VNTPFTAYKGEGRYQFVCYAHDDARAVFRELERLRDLGFNFWYDEGISLGQEWTEELAQAINGAAEVLFFVSPRSVASRNCRNELQYAESRSKKIISIHLEPTELPDGLELAIGLSQAIRRYDVSDESFVSRVVAALSGPDGGSEIPVRHNARSRRPIITAAVAILVSIGALSSGFWRTDRDQADVDPPSIAVLPFENLSSDPEQAYFSQGVAEEILSSIARRTDIKVISRSSSFSLADQNLPLPEIAGQLGVNHVLQGSVRRSGDIVRIAVQLVGVRTDSYLWSESYDRKFNDIFAIQDEIASEVAAALNVVLRGAAGRGSTSNAEAYALYLRARYLLGIGPSNDDLRLMERQLKHALELDPGYVAAWRELGRVYLQQLSRGIVSGEQARNLRWDTVSRALEIDPDDAVSNAYRGYQEMAINDDLQEGARRFEKAIAAAPRHEDVLRPLILFMLQLDRVEASLPFAQLVVEQDPLCGVCLLNLGRIYRMLGRFDDADAQFVTASSVLKRSNQPTFERAEVQLERGNNEVALELLEQITEGDVRRLAGLAIAYHRLGREAEYAGELAALISQVPEPHPLVATVYAGTGQPELAFEQLHAAVSEAQRPSIVHGMPRPAAWGPYREDARWKLYLEKINRSPERLRGIQFNPGAPTRGGAR